MVTAIIYPESQRGHFHLFYAEFRNIFVFVYICHTTEIRYHHITRTSSHNILQSPRLQNEVNVNKSVSTLSLSYPCNNLKICATCLRDLVVKIVPIRYNGHLGIFCVLKLVWSLFAVSLGVGGVLFFPVFSCLKPQNLLPSYSQSENFYGKSVFTF